MATWSFEPGHTSVPDRSTPAPAAAPSPRHSADNKRVTGFSA
jgi:hypothetical protein